MKLKDDKIKQMKLTEKRKSKTPYSTLDGLSNDSNHSSLRLIYRSTNTD